MKTLEVDVWNIVENGYTPPKSRLKGATARKLHKCHATIRNESMYSLSDDEKAKVGHYTSTKHIWVNLQNSYSKETSMETSHAFKKDQEEEHQKK